MLSLYKFNYCSQYNDSGQLSVSYRNYDLEEKTEKLQLISLIKDVGTCIKLKNNQESPQNKFC